MNLSVIYKYIKIIKCFLLLNKSILELFIFFVFIIVENGKFSIL